MGRSRGSRRAAASDEEAAQTFFDAVVAGDRDAAAAVAGPAALAFFEPWEPVEGLSFSGVQDGVFFINPGAAPFQCTVADGVVLGCQDEPTGEDGVSDEEIAQAFFDAVVAGDRDAAALVAGPAALAFFEPWEPVEGLTFTGVQDGVFFINPGAAPFQCTISGGFVRNCIDEPLGD